MPREWLGIQVPRELGRSPLLDAALPDAVVGAERA
jgi:hypothetical protein